MIMEAKLFHNLPSANQTTRNVDIIQSESKGLRPRNASSRTGEDGCLSSSRANLPFLHFFVLSRPSTDWIMPTTLVRVILFIQPTNSNANLF